MQTATNRASLLKQLDGIQQRIQEWSDQWFETDDARWFFAHAQAYILRQIIANIRTFPEAERDVLLRVSIHFGKSFLEAILKEESKPFWRDVLEEVGPPPIWSSDQWERAFAACKLVRRAEDGRMRTPTPPIRVDVEACGALMANVHITKDLPAALRSESVRISPQSYSNLVIFVEAGAESAIRKLRWWGMEQLELTIKRRFVPRLEKMWRNQVYRDLYDQDVPPEDPKFTEQVQWVP